jgi:hypothetical protein
MKSMATIPAVILLLCGLFLGGCAIAAIQAFPHSGSLPMLVIAMALIGSALLVLRRATQNPTEPPPPRAHDDTPQP